MIDKVIFLAADHAGYELKNFLREYLLSCGYNVTDLGTNGPEPVDYPDFASRLCGKLSGGSREVGVLVCGSGIGMSMAANRYGHIRAALARDSQLARLSRQHNDANVLVLGARLTTVDVAIEALKTFLDTPFDGGRHAGRVSKLGTGLSV